MTSTPARRGVVTSTIVFIVAICALLMLRPELERSIRVAAVVACAVALACVVTVVRVNGDRAITVGSIYLVLFALFHVGLLIPIAFGFSPLLLNANDTTWVNSPGFSSAAVLAAIAQLAVTVGYLMSIRRAGTDWASRERQPDVDPVPVADGSAIVGLGLLLLGLAIWTRNAITGGVSLGGSYLDYLTATANSDMPTANLLIGFGMGVVSSSRYASVRRWALIAFCVWAVPAFVIGLRGEVILPAAAFLVVAARRRRIRLRPWMGLAVVGALAVGSGVRVIRQLGIGDGTVKAADLNPLAGLAELGYSIRPLVVVSDFQDRMGQPFVGVATYLAPFRRFILGRILDRQVLAVADDPAVFGGWIAGRVGPIGGSPAAEAYRVGGVLAMILVMAAIGVALALLDALSRSQRSDAVIGMLTFVALLWVRNDFTPVPAECVLTVPVVVAIWLAEQRVGSRSKAEVGNSS